MGEALGRLDVTMGRDVWTPLISCWPAPEPIIQHCPSRLHGCLKVRHDDKGELDRSGSSRLQVVLPHRSSHTRLRASARRGPLPAPSFDVLCPGLPTLIDHDPTPPEPR